MERFQRLFTTVRLVSKGGSSSLSTILEIKMTIVPRQESSQGDEKLCQWRVNIHEVLCFDIVAGEFAKVHLIKTALRMSIQGFLSIEATYTMLFGFEILYNLTGTATVRSPTKILSSLVVRFGLPVVELELVFGFPERWPASLVSILSRIR